MKTEEYADLVIPELEDAKARAFSYWWTAKEDAIIMKYYPIRTLSSLVTYFAKTDSPRTRSAIAGRANILGLTVSRGPCPKKK